MKNILGILGTFVLCTASGVPVLANTSFFSEQKKQDDNIVPHEIIYTRLFSTYHIFKQIADKYCAPSAVQGVLQYVLGESPSQEELARRLNTEEDGGTRASYVTAVLNSYIDEFTYYHNLIRRDFGRTEFERVLFQDAVVYSINRNIPPLLMMHGFVPWSVGASAHTIVITGIEVHDNPALTRYQVAEASSDFNEFVWFSSTSLQNMFSEGNGSLILSTDNFDFWNRTINIPVAAHNASMHGIVSTEDTILTESADLFNEAGIVSLATLQIAQSVILPNFTLHYEWIENDFHTKKQTLFVKDIKEDSTWVKDTSNSKQWTEWLEGSATINFFFNQTFSAEDMKLTLNFKLNGYSSGRHKPPYVDCYMGKVWQIKF